jgi:pimeloyl-ACP methyl ester carboxylesterase
MKGSGVTGSGFGSLGRKAGQAMLIAISMLLAVVLVLVGVLLALSPGRVKPIVGENGEPVAGSFSEKVFVDINGVKQGMFIQSKDVSHPVLLYLHGGMPEYFLTEKYPTGLEDMFTVVWWEQRGSGLSYSADIAPTSRNLEQMISDTLVLTDHLRARFHQDKIYLMCHSGGSFIGIQAAARAPEKYYAYIGVAQMANQLRSEKLAYDHMVAQFRQDGNTSMLRKLEAAPVTMEGGVPPEYSALLRDQAMHMLGVGTMHDMRSVATGIMLPSFLSPQYTLPEKINTWTGKSRSGVAALFNVMISTDLSRSLAELMAPVYFLEGRYDYTCAYSVAREYFDVLKAPVKGFYTFEGSAHSPIFEEPQRVQQILREDVLMGTNTLADP